MRFKLGDKIYEAASVDRLTLRHWMRIEAETGALNEPRSWSDIRAMVLRVSELDEAEVEKDPEFPWFLGVVIWATRFDAGETDLTLADAVDIPMGDIEVLADAPGPQDHQAPGGGARPPRARAASARAAKRPARKASSTASRSGSTSSGA